MHHFGIPAQEISVTRLRNMTHMYFQIIFSSQTESCQIVYLTETGLHGPEIFCTPTKDLWINTGRMILIINFKD